jgi:hypothetical protein
MNAESIVLRALQALVDVNVDTFRNCCAPSLLESWAPVGDDTGPEDQLCFDDCGIVRVDIPSPDGSQIVHAALQVPADCWAKFGHEEVPAIHEVTCRVRAGMIEAIEWGACSWQRPPKSFETWLGDLRDYPGMLITRVGGDS